MSAAPLRRGRLTGWAILVSVLALLGYVGRAIGGKPPKDAAYLYSTAASGLFQYGLILLVVLLIAGWAPARWSLLALRRPTDWSQTFVAVIAVFAAVYLASYVVDQFADPGREQGLTPQSWDSSRAVPFAVNFAVFVVVAPVVEELTYRGLGYSLLEPLGRLQAILWVGIAFGLAHGLLEGLVILIVFGCGLAWLRERSGSVYPGMVVHAVFNAAALIAAVTT